MIHGLLKTRNLAFEINFINKIILFKKNNSKKSKLNTYRMRTNKILQRTLVFIGTLCTHFALAQQSYSLKEAVSYTIQNHASIRNAQLDILTAASKVQEIKGIGLPQVNGNIGYMNNLVIQKMLVPAKTFNPAAPEDAVNAVEFGVPNNLQYGVGVSQLLFDGTYLLGLKAADVYKELSTKAIVKTKQ
jgi:hypothetical protein